MKGQPFKCESFCHILTANSYANSKVIGLALDYEDMCHILLTSGPKLLDSKVKSINYEH